MDGRKYQTGLAAMFAAAARTPAVDQQTEFRCETTCRVGAYQLMPGDRMTAVADGWGLYYLYCDWADGCLGRFRPQDINKIAGRQVVE